MSYGLQQTLDATWGKLLHKIWERYVGFYPTSLYTLKKKKVQDETSFLYINLYTCIHFHILCILQANGLNMTYH